MHDPDHFLLVSDEGDLLVTLNRALSDQTDPPQGRLVPFLSLAESLRRERPLFVALDERAADPRAALGLLRYSSTPDVPLLLLCAPGRQNAGVTAMNDGAADFMLTDDLARFAPLARRWRSRPADATRLRDFFDQSPHAILLFDVQSPRRLLLEDLNPAAERLLARPRADLMGRPASEVLPAAVAEALGRAVMLCLERGTPSALEQAWQVGGVPRTFETTLVPIRPPGHTIERLGVCLRDVSDRKAFEKALADREEMFRRLVESTRVVPWEADLVSRRFTYVGPQAEAWASFPLTEWVRPGFWARLVHPDDRDRTEAEMAEQWGTGSDHVLEYRLLSAAGRTIWVQHLASVVLDGDGRPVLRGFFVDVTARREAEEQMRGLNAELERRVQERTVQLAASNRELEAFSYSVSHDLRAPLRAIDGFSRALLEDHVNVLDEDGQDMLRRVRAASQRMGELIDDLLTLSRVSRCDMEREQIDLSAIAFEVAATLQRQTVGRRVEWAIAPGLMASGDARLVRVLMENLLGNAWKYTGKRPSARIELGTTEEGTFFVRDDGAGFDPRYASKLFQPFQRLHRPDEFEGHGIGLATVQRVVARHGGRAWAKSKPDHGATFFFTLGGG